MQATLEIMIWFPGVAVCCCVVAKRVSITVPPDAAHNRLIWINHKPHAAHTQLLLVCFIHTLNIISQ